MGRDCAERDCWRRALRPERRTLASEQVLDPAVRSRAAMVTWTPVMEVAMMTLVNRRLAFGFVGERRA